MCFTACWNSALPKEAPTHRWCSYADSAGPSAYAKCSSKRVAPRSHSSRVGQYSSISDLRCLHAAPSSAGERISPHSRNAQHS